MRCGWLGEYGRWDLHVSSRASAGHRRAAQTRSDSPKSLELHAVHAECVFVIANIAR
jgi:hypothetical protein